MLNFFSKYKYKIFFTTVFVLLLAVIRAYEDQLFYDPFLDYFKSNYQNLPLPEYDNFQLFLGLFIRYFLNSMVSLAIIYTIFKDLEITKFASIIYFIFFAILIFFFFVQLSYFGQTNKMMLFYIRRFLIQPLLLLLFIPALYYQKQVK